MKYPRSVEAAVALGMDKKVLAEALWTEVPTRRGRPLTGAPTIDVQLAAVAAEIEAETGEKYAVATLAKYRQVAAWAANDAGDGGIPWADASWTAHVQAYEKGETFARFAAEPATKRRVRERNGGKTGDVPAAARAINANPGEAVSLVQGLTPEAVEQVQEALSERRLNDLGFSATNYRDVPDPVEPADRLMDRMGTDFLTVRGMIADHRTARRRRLADVLQERLVDLVAGFFNDLSPVPDNAEEVTR